MFEIIGKKVNVKEYLNSYMHNMNWTPNFCVLHNTASPSISQRPNGFTEEQMKSLQGYYSGMGWKGGPHFFVDQNGVWAFNPINKKGTHSPSWNATAIGVEMLGDYNVESFNSGDGQKIQSNALKLMADLHTFFELDPSTMKIHKEDPKTTHDCPGKNVIKSDFVKAFSALMNQISKIIIYKKGYGHEPAGVVNGYYKNNTNYAQVEDLKKIVGFDNGLSHEQKVRDVLGDKYTYSWDAANLKLYCVEK
jgi:hypothetical protein